MYHGRNVGVVVPAAGEGRRYGGKVRKQFVELRGKPLWAYAVEKLMESPEVDEIVVVAPAAMLGALRSECAARRLHKVAAVVEGGPHRQDSVWSGLGALKTHSPDLVLVHDAVRPFLSESIIGRVLEACSAYGAAVPAVQAKETIKVSNGDSFVVSTPERESLWLVQTPQGFRAEIVYEAFRKAQNDGFRGTDEASLVERMGVKVKIVAGDYSNVKVTSGDDLELAGFLLGKGV